MDLAVLERLEFMLAVLIAQGASLAEEQFGLGLGFLLDGIARCLAGAESPARSAH